VSSLQGRVALVTGGGKGVGAAIAARLASSGARVAVLGRDADALARVAAETKGVALQADVTDAAAVDRALTRVREELGPIDVLVQNAGIALSAPLAATDDAAWDRVMAVNVTSVFRIARAVVPEMAKRGWGRVVHVASNAGLTGYAYTSAYCASKHALVGLTRALAAEHAKSGVTVNAVCPGFIDTEMTVRTVETIAAKTKRTKDDARRALEELSPQKRLMTVNEVAHVVAMLCGDDARGVNGQAIPIDGGQVMT
jgi:NAD(P)-dependent dehydrogenase (short-subunit alcohol dehydrogenase family)